MDDNGQKTNAVPQPPVTDQEQVQPSTSPLQPTIPQPAAGHPGGAEREPVAAREKPAETVMEIPTEPEVEKKLEGYIEKTEKAAELKQPVVDDYTQDILLKSATPQDVVVTLPLTEEQVEKGLHMKIYDSIRWLAEWCVRQIKMLHGRVRYKNPDNN